MLLLLAALAGWVDALSFTELGKVFTSFQSGNLIFLGLALDEGNGELLAGAAVSLAAFVGGTALGAFVVGRAEVDVSAVRSLVPALALECALLAGFAVCWQVLGTPATDSAGRIALVAVGAAAMGVQGGAVFALRIPGVVTNAMTATLMLGGVLLGLRARSARAARDATELSGGMIAGLCGAYAVSALTVSAIGRPALAAAVPAAALAVSLGALTIGRSAGRRAVASART